ncbi:MAG: M20/M25/M40 family metallo-hydrolase [Anaerolineales bacterium]|nr:M20/M25/M40 family metallo-hydrolase [Anaerolineales bacterium]
MKRNASLLLILALLISGFPTVNASGVNDLPGDETPSLGLMQKQAQGLRPSAAIVKGLDSQPIVEGILAQITQEMVVDYTKDLSGERPVLVGGEPYTILTRYTYSDEPIQKATHYIGEHLDGLGLAVEYQVWDDESNPNVIGELPGLTNPEAIYIIGAHLDDLPNAGRAPGADDNASGSVATLIAADLLSQYQWGCTLRFAFWTGEEQGMLGSQDYAERAYLEGEDILGYLNLDMIAWNTDGSSPDIDLHVNTSVSGTLEIANLYVDVVNTYDLNLIPQVILSPAACNSSDHSSFLNYGFPAILAIEDFSDFNPNYHRITDNLANLEDLPYYTEFVKANVAAFAHIAGCLITTSTGQVEGTVRDESSGMPIANGLIEIENTQGYTIETTTNTLGEYTHILPSGIYTITASAAGYLAQVATNTLILTDAVTILDFSLEQEGCSAISSLDFSWQPESPMINKDVIFTAEASGTLPILFTWDFGNLTTAQGITVTHVFTESAFYPVTLTAVNACSVTSISQTVPVYLRWIAYLPNIQR